MSPTEQGGYRGLALVRVAFGAMVLATATLRSVSAPADCMERGWATPPIRARLAVISIVAMLALLGVQATVAVAWTTQNLPPRLARTARFQRCRAPVARLFASPWDRGPTGRWLSSGTDGRGRYNQSQRATKVRPIPLAVLLA